MDAETGPAHELIGEASRNELLTTMLGVIWDVMRESREQWLQTNQRAIIYAQH